MLKKTSLTAIFMVLSLLLSPFTAFAQNTSTAPIELKEKETSLEVSVSNGTDLKINKITCEKGTDECIISWETNSAPPVKAKIVFWTSNQPNITDASFMEKEAPKGTKHKLVLKTSEMPKSFIKIRISYAISEEAGAYTDLDARSITK